MYQHSHQNGTPFFGREFLDGVTEHSAGHTGAIQFQIASELFLIAFSGFAKQPTDGLLKKVVEWLGLVDEDIGNCVCIIKLSVADELHRGNDADALFPDGSMPNIRG